MFQSFDEKNRNGDAASRLRDVRSALQEAGVDWFLVPHADAHQNEYLPERGERLAWLTGFTGSAGFAVIGRERTFLYVDGRYTIQARQQTNQEAFEICDLVANPPIEHLKAHLKKSEKIGFDAWLLTIGQEKRWQDMAEAASCSLVAIDNPIDAVWQDQPKLPCEKAWCHPVEYAGDSVETKLTLIRSQIKEAGADCLLITDPAAVAWAFNLRGSDVVHNPLALAFAVIPSDSAESPVLFIDAGKLGVDDRTTLEKTLEIQPYESLIEWVSDNAENIRFGIDPAQVAASLGAAIHDAGGSLVEKPDPVTRLRAIKNETEIHGSRAAHLRDGVAMARFLAWLDRQQAGSVDEIAAARKLEEMRKLTAEEMGSELREIAFDTISGAGANGAIIHYRVTNKSNLTLETDSLYLVDSGGQYVDGTTDITRSIAIGTPPAEAVEDATLVLKGHISIAMARFPAGTRGIDLDPLARIALWRAGKDYAHGTGHGVGSYLNVHEGPQSISRRGMAALEPGMIISNEPGYYREGAYGIRIENLVLVTGAEAISGGDQLMLGFETLTLCPIDLRLVDPEKLTMEERDWLNAYHHRVHDSLAPHLNYEDRSWLERATRAI